MTEQITHAEAEAMLRSALRLLDRWGTDDGQVETLLGLAKGEDG